MSSYVPDVKGLAEIGRSPALQAAVLAAAARGAQAAATANPRGSYSVRPQPVRAGYREEPRVGAVVENSAPDAVLQESQTRALVRAVPVIEAS